MLFYDATLRKERRVRRARTMDIAIANARGKPLTEHLARLKD